MRLEFGPLIRILTCSMLVLSLSACAENDKSGQSLLNTMGGVVGGFAGGALGSTLGKGLGRGLAMTAGVAMGAKLGHDFAHDFTRGLTPEDKLRLEHATNDALNHGAPGEAVDWSNPDSGTYGTVTADQVTTPTQSEDCRQFETTVNVKGEDRATTGTACRTQNGAWKIIADPEVTT